MIGRTISHYEILEKLGEGGMGVVYKARDTKLDREVAIKFLPPHLSADPEAVKRFVHEAKSASAIDHQHIGTIYEIDETDDGSTFIVMAFYEGETLRKRIDRGGITVTEALKIASQIASGLARAHEKGIVHRDIKPQNILLTRDGEAKIIDFGLAKLAGRTRLTREGSTLGTAAYMSPEQARGEEVDHRSDIFSLGSILYELLAGEPPFKGDHDMAVMYSITHEEPDALFSRESNIPVELGNLTDKAMAKKVEDRYQNAKELARDLKDITPRLDDLPQRSTMQSIVLHNWKKIALISSLAFVSIGAALIIPRLFQREPEMIRIAVLPFENLSADESQRYFVEGMTDEIRTRLGEVGAKTGKLAVISRTSCYRIKNLNLALPDIARDLNISHVIEGSSQLLGDQVQISVQLTNAQSDEHVWGDIYEGDLAEIFSIQSDIAARVAGTLGQILSPAQAQSIKGAGTDNPDAYNLLLMGNYFLRQRSKRGFEKAKECAERAIEKDPSYAEAYRMLADAYMLLAIYGFETRERMYPNARDNMLMAIELDDSHVGTQTIIGSIRMWFEWDLERAEKAFLRALEIDSNNARAHLRYSWLLLVTRQFDKALSHLAVTNELDPLSVISRQDIGEFLYHAGRHDESIKASLEAISFDPNFYQTYIFLALAYIEKGMIAEAESALEKYKMLIHERSGGPARMLAIALAYIYSDREPGEILDEVMPDYQDDSDFPFTMGSLYIIHGDNEKGFEYLEMAFEKRVPRLLHLNFSPVFNNVRTDERYLSLIERMGFDK